MFELQAFGPLGLRGEDGRSLEGVLAQPKRAALVAYLVLAQPRGFHRRDHLVALFWPELDDARARGALNQALSFLRRELEGGALLTRGPEDVGLDHQRVRCDVVEFEAALARGDRPAALAMYGGELLSGFHVAGAPDFAEWIDSQRERLRRLASRAAMEEAEHASAAGRLPEAIVAARRALELDPYDEPALRCVVRLLDESGDRAGAIRAYDSFAARLGTQLEVEPSPETQSLIQAVRQRSGAGPIASGIRLSGEELVEVAPSVRPSDSTIPASAQRSRRLAWPLLVGLAIVLVSGIYLYRESQTPPGPRPTGGTASFITTLDGFETHPDLSPDGERVVFAWAAEPANNRRLMIMSANGGTPALLTDGVWDDSYPAWSPDGQKIAFLRYNPDTRMYDVMTITVLAGETRVLASTRAGRGMDWSPAGNWIAYLDRPDSTTSGRVFLLDAETGKRQQLSRAAPTEARLFDSNPIFSPDGRVIAFLRRTPDSGGGGTLHTQGVRDTSAVAHETPNDFIFDLDWAPDGNGWVLASGDPSSRELLWLPSDGGAAQPLPIAAGALHVSVSPRTRALVYSEQRQDHDIWRVSGPNATEATPAHVLIRSTRDDLYPAYSPNGQRIAFLSAQSGSWEVWMSDGEGRNQRQVTNLGHAIFPLWSPDGQSITFSSIRSDIPDALSDVFIVNRTGGFPVNLTEDDRLDAIPTMSSDGTWIYFQSRSSPSAPWEIWRQPTQGGAKEFVVSSDYGTLLRPMAAADGRIYYYEPGPAEVREGGRVWTVSPDGDAAPVLRLPLGTNFIQWTVWENALAYFHHQDSFTSIEVYEPRSGSTTRVATLPRFPALPTFPGTDVLFQLHPALAISPDGRWILYVVGSGSADLVLWRDPW